MLTAYWSTDRKERDLFGGPGHRWEYHIKTDFKERDWVGMGWIRVAQSRIRWRMFMKAIVNIRIP